MFYLAKILTLSSKNLLKKVHKKLKVLKLAGEWQIESEWHQIYNLNNFDWFQKTIQYSELANYLP